MEANGTVVYPNLDLQAHCIVVICPASQSAMTDTAATIYKDIDSVVCDYCIKTWHMADYCWK